MITYNLSKSFGIPKAAALKELAQLILVNENLKELCKQTRPQTM